MNTKYLKAIEEFGKVPKSKELIKHSLNEIKSNKENIFGTIMSALLGAFFALWMGFSINTIELFHKALEILLNVQLVIFGFIFSIYSIILAFFSDDYVEKIVQVDDESKKPFLIKILTYYESILFLYFINVSLTGVIIFLMICVPLNFRLFSNNIVNNITSTILMFFYFSFSFRIFYELKSTIYNTIMLFRSSITYRLLSFIQKDNDNNDD
mgnify:CR=1 FL=1|jgi:hypothetical protein